MANPRKGFAYFGLNSCQVGGLVMKMDKVGASTLLYVRYGPQRQDTGGPVQFVNMVVVRVPDDKNHLLRGVNSGSCIAVYARVNSVIEEFADELETVTEVVAINIRVNNLITGIEEFESEDSQGEEKGDA